VSEFILNSNISLATLRARSYKLLFYRLLALLAFLGAVASIAWFSWNNLLLIDGKSWEIFFPPAEFAVFFWWGILLAGYGWYRIARERNIYKKISYTNELADKVSVDIYFTEEMWLALKQAFKYATRLGAAEVDPLHLLAGCLTTSTGRRLFIRLGIDFKKLIGTLNTALASLARRKSGQPKMASASQSVILNAARLATERKFNQIEVTELLQILAKSESRVPEVLEELVVTPQAIENITIWFSLRRKLISDLNRVRQRAQWRPKRSLDRAYLAVATPYLGTVSRDLTMSAARGHLAPCIARNSEMKEIFRLFEGSGSGVVLIGESGVGKTSIIEGFAQAMVTEEVPKALQDKHLRILSLSHLLSGATAEEAGERLFRVIKEAVRAGNIVLGIENIQELMGASSGSGPLTLGDTLANAILKYHLQVIATCNTADWRAKVEGSFLGQSLQKVEVLELDSNRSIQAVEAYVPQLEFDHHVFFAYPAIETVVELSRRYFLERHLPEKAIKLADEVAVYVKEHQGKGATVTAEAVAQVVAGKVHIPLTQVSQEEKKKLLNLETILHQRIVGQDEAVTLVAQALRRARVNLRDQKRPVASFLFLGPTGVGKTELAKVVTSEYFGGEDKMVRLDMSEYQTAESAYRLVGNPAGSDKMGLLTEAVRQNPYNLLLLDEIEKAHPDILNIFLQLLDDGRLTDATGRTVDFTNCIIIATSNAGTQYIQQRLTAGDTKEAIKKALLESKLQEYFRPEFLNRFDGIVVFKPLNKNDVEKVTELLLGKLAKGLESKGIHLQASPAAIKELASKGFDPLFGARPLRRVIQENVDGALANYLLQGKLTRRDIVVLEPGGVVRVQKAEKL